jgi:hypothetical protein
MLIGSEELSNSNRPVRPPSFAQLHRQGSNTVLAFTSFAKDRPVLRDHDRFSFTAKEACLRRTARADRNYRRLMWGKPAR